MSCISNTNLVAMAVMLFGCCSALTNVYHPGVKLKTGMAYMPSNTDKLFGVDIYGNLKERIHTGGRWQWVHHGNGGERLASTPCILQDGKIFIISEKGNLFERHWWAGSWRWTNHHRPSHCVKIRASGCTCTNTNGLGRVFVVGIDLQLYERYWNNNQQPSGWAWRYHGSPNPSMKIGFNLDSCNEVGCATEVYLPGTDGNLWKRKLVSGSSFQWQNMGRPYHPLIQNEFVHSVRVARSRVFIATKTDKICRYYNFNGFSCMGAPHGSGSTSLAHIEMSKPIYVGSGCNRLRSGWYIALNSWDPIHHRRGRLFTLRMTTFTHYVLENNVSGYNAKVDAPLFFKSGVCPKIFTVNSNGGVWERL